MKMTTLLLATSLTVTLAAGCAEKKSPVDKAVDSTKDALDIRDHEKLKDGAEDVRDAVKDTADGVKDEVKKKD